MKFVLATDTFGSSTLLSISQTASTNDVGMY